MKRDEITAPPLKIRATAVPASHLAPLPPSKGHSNGNAVIQIWDRTCQRHSCFIVLRHLRAITANLAGGQIMPWMATRTTVLPTLPAFPTRHLTRAATSAPVGKIALLRSQAGTKSPQPRI